MNGVRENGKDHLTFLHLTISQVLRVKSQPIG